ncbi:MAG: hypothetical protein ABSD03_14260 [Vulcanimicrobiaceae bacterium]|jgi:hypothetical protein
MPATRLAGAIVEPTPDPAAIVRVRSGGGAVHYASLRLVRQHEPQQKLVAVCATRIGDPRLTLNDVTCSFCSGSLCAARDVTNEIMAGCCL